MKKAVTIRILPFFLGVLLIMSSCKKGHNGDIPHQPNSDTVRPVPNGQPLITRYEFAPNVYTLFKYNSYGQVTGVTDINNIVISNRTVTYKVDGKVDKIIDMYGFWKLAYGNNNQLVQADFYATGNASVQSYYKYAYDGQQVTQLLLFNNYGTNIMQPRAKVDFRYDPNGDITRSDSYLWDLNTGSYEKASYRLFTSDNHPNPVYPIRDIFMILYGVEGPHNAIKAQSFGPNGSVDQNNTFNFKYNNDGYPISAEKRNLAASPNVFVELNFDYK